MATWQKQITINTLTKEGITEWINTVHEAMIAVGCVPADDTGQIDIEDYPNPQGGVQNVFGYRIYEINDKYSGDQPIYVKISFRGVRNGATTSLVPESHITVGFATDGNGAILAPYTSANSPVSAYFSNTGGSTLPITDSPCYACKVDGFLFLAIGIGCMRYSSSTPVTATFFAISRVSDDDVALYQFLNTRIDNGAPANQTELAYSVVNKVANSSLDAIFGTLPSISRASVGGLIVGSPAIISGSFNVYVDPCVVSVPIPEAAVNSVISLSNDGLVDRTYMVLPAPVGTGVVPVERKLPIVADTKYRFTRAIAMRWE